MQSKMLDNNKVLSALKKVIDPKTGQNIIQAKRVENFVVSGNHVSFTIVINENDSNIKSELNFKCIEEIQKVYPNAEVNIHLKQVENKKSNPISHIDNVIAVASGKGGVGKSTVSVNLAVTLAKKGYKVGLLDADVYGPSIPTMMGLVGERPKVEQLYGKHKIRPLEAHGIHVMSIGFIVDPEQAIVLRGPRLGGIIKQFLEDCLWPELDYLVIDLPPGTGDVQLTLVQTIPITGAVMVTTPQEVAVIDAVKAMNMFLLPNINVPILGIVENMSWFTPEELPENKYFIFGEGGGHRLAERSETTLLGQIPIVKGIREGGDSGSPIGLQENDMINASLSQIVDSFENEMSKRKQKPPTQRVEVTK